ncbi:MAG: P22 coat - protein 5 family protein [Anaerolineaceae bacterium]|nr:P22 coat - protein 5 family protein [Anaerolineaceae bacterium]
MGNTFTNLIPTIYQALDVVSREMIGFIPAVNKNTAAERAAVGEEIMWPVVEPGTPGDVSPGVTGPTGTDMAPTTPKVTISKSKNQVFYLTGEELKGLKNSNSDQTIIQNSFEQAFRSLANLIEIDLAAAALAGASRAYGTAGTTPFATSGDMTDLAETMKILDDNGAPQNRHLVVNTAALAKLRGKQAVVLAEAGSNELLRQGALAMLEGVKLHASGGIKQHTKGTGASYVTSGATAVDVEDIALITGNGTVLAGDVVTFAADAVNKYVVGTGVTAPGTISLNRPGARVTIPTGNALTIGNSFTPNVLFSSDALFLATRAPAAPEGGDSADDVMVVRDPVSGLAFEIRMYRQYRQVAYEIAIAWGTKHIKSEHIAILLG